MSRSFLSVLSGIVLLALLLVPTIAQAHETITVGDYTIEYGWANEPPVAGQPNALVVSVGGSDSEDVDVSQLTVQVVYGGQTQNLSLEPAGEDTHGQFIAHLTPTHAGQYTVRFGGKLSTTDVSAEVQPEEVQQTDPAYFPEPLPSLSDLNSRIGAIEQRAATVQLIGIAGLVVGLLGLAAGGLSLTRRK